VRADRPIGIFDSGVGGLSVLREVRRELPSEDLLYVADSAYAPYGERDAAFIGRRAAVVVEFLEREGSKAVVVACNTATGMAVEALRTQFPLPIVAIEPAVKPAVSLTHSGVVGVLATTQTLSSPKFSRLLSSHGTAARVLVQACPGLVDQVEAGELSGPRTYSLVRQYVTPLLEAGADVLVLGCTHYPFLTAVVANVAGPGVTILDPAVAVARELRRRLDVEGLLKTPSRKSAVEFDRGGDRPLSGRDASPADFELVTGAIPAGDGKESKPPSRSAADQGKERFVTTGQVEQVQRIMTQLWGRDVTVAAADV
jgi:glutamate racemase